MPERIDGGFGMGTSRLEFGGASRKHSGDFLTYFLIPWAGATLAFFILIWWRNPSGFASNWPVGIVVSGVLAFCCFWSYWFIGRLRGPLWRALH
jgi:hypothetical protein